MDLYLVSVLVFVAFLVVFVYKDRRKFTRESIFLLRRTQRGKEFLMWIGTSFPRFWKVVGFFSVLTGFVVSVLGLKMLIDNIAMAIEAGSSAPSLALLIPSPTSEAVLGYGYLAVPFWYWIICIALLALVHEGFHGIFTAREKTRIKSLGFGLFTVIPLAFVEPDEKQLEKRGVWPQLRVFSAGSFANFLLAALSVVLLSWMFTSVYLPAGVQLLNEPFYQKYPAAYLNLTEVESIGGNEVSGIDGIVSVLQEYGENDTLEITTQNGTMYLKKVYMEAQLDALGGDDTVLAFLDYPAAKAGLEGVIVDVNGMEIKDIYDLSMALEAAGEGSDIDVTVRKGETLETVVLTTAPYPGSSEFAPTTMTYVSASLEQVIPGSIGFQLELEKWLLSLSGQRTGGTWNYLEGEKMLWEWVSENYPGLRARAQERASALEDELSERNVPGFIGIVGITTYQEIKPGLEMFSGVIIFMQGLLGFLFVINLGVGIVNLLPVKPLDGGKMWDIVLNRYVPKHARRIMKALGYIVLAILIANFIPFGVFL